MADNELAGAIKDLDDVIGELSQAVADFTGGGDTTTTPAVGAAAAAATDASTNTTGGPNSSSSSSTKSQPLPKKLYRHQSLTVGDRLVNTYVADDKSPDSPPRHRQGFCVGFSGTRGEPKVRLLLDNGQQIAVLVGSVQKVAKEEIVFEGDPADEELWFADFDKDIEGDLKQIAADLHRRATDIRKRVKQRRRAEHMEQQHKQQAKTKRPKLADDTSDTNAAASKPAAATTATAAAAAAAAASTELSTEQKRERLALKRKRLELEVAQKKLAPAQAKVTHAQKRSLLHKKKEQERALTLAGGSRQATPVPGETPSKAPPRKKRKLADLAALRRPSILVQNLSSSGPKELVYIQPRKLPQTENNGTEAKSRLPTPQREEKKSELQKRQKEVMERRAELLRKAEMLKQRQQVKRKSLEVEEEDCDEVVDDNDDAHIAAGDGAEMNSDDEGDDDLGHDNTIQSGTASEIENDDAVDNDAGQMKQLRLRRLELQSTISQQAQTQTELKQSIEVQNLRGMVRTQLGVLTKQGQNLSERTAQLKQCTADIEVERKEVEDAEQRLEDLLEKKRRLETMAGTVTDKLLESRKKKAEILKGKVVDDCGGPDAAAGGPLSRSRSRSPRQGGRQSRSKRNKGGAAADFF